jgi:hypothetical protein
MIYVRLETNTDLQDARDEIQQAAGALGAVGHYESDDLLDFVTNALWQRENRVLPLYRSSKKSDRDRIGWLLNGAMEHIFARLQHLVDEGFPKETDQ